MKKKNIAFILFGVAAINLLSIPISLMIFPTLYERMDMPSSAIRMGITSILTSSIIAITALFIAGLIVYIKFRNE
ncbi:MAG: hypothetical protein ACFE8B_14655 [Candidatus Hermodarchaeota archaeon]